MDDRGLSDIGLGRQDADREANLPFWREPVIDEASRGRRS